MRYAMATVYSYDSGLSELKMTPVKIKDLLIAFPQSFCL